MWRPGLLRSEEPWGREWSATHPVFCLKKSMDREAWPAILHEVARSRTQLLTNTGIVELFHLLKCKIPYLLDSNCHSSLIQSLGATILLSVSESDCLNLPGTTEFHLEDTIISSFFHVVTWLFLCGDMFWFSFYFLFILC